MNKRILPIIMSIVMFSPLMMIGQTTFTKDIAPIIYNHCTTCHRTGEIGPFSLTNYEEVKNHGATIKYVTETRYMPPWKADPEYRHFLDENVLSEDQILKIADWVENGMPYGSSAEEPPLPDFPSGSLLGEPDLVLSFDRSYMHKGNNKDEYRYFVLPTGLTETKNIKAIELRPGNKKIVHHALFFNDTDGLVAQHDALTEEYGFTAYNGFDENRVLFYEQYPGYVPGQKARYYPESLGQKMEANSDLVIQMHYAPYPTDESDSSTVNIFFADEKENIERKVKNKILLPTDLISGTNSFYILPNEVKTFTAKWTMYKDISLLGVFPHMHLLGKNWEVWLERPNGTRENLIKIDDWDFDWQGGYNFKQFIVAPVGSNIYAKATYDNTADNYRNPSNPPVFVSWGEKTTDEMYYLPISYVDYIPGDELAVFDQTTSTIEFSRLERENVIYDVFPNPSSEGLINIGFKINRGTSINASIYDMQGSKVKNLNQGEFFSIGSHVINLNASSLRTGSYFVKITGLGIDMSKQFQILR